jgi:hypothetical protein
MHMIVPIRAGTLKVVCVMNKNQVIPANAAGKAEIMYFPLLELLLFRSELLLAGRRVVAGLLNPCVIVGEPPAILPIIWRPQRSGNTTQGRQLLLQSRSPSLVYYVVDQDRDCELLAIFPRPSFLWLSYWAVDSPHNAPHLLIFNAKAACPVQYGIRQWRINVGYLGWTESLRVFGPVVDSRDNFLPTARVVQAALRCMPWFERSLHVPRKLPSRACQLSFDRSVWQSQDSGCLKD